MSPPDRAARQALALAYLAELLGCGTRARFGGPGPLGAYFLGTYSDANTDFDLYLRDRGECSSFVAVAASRVLVGEANRSDEARPLVVARKRAILVGLVPDEPSL